MQELIEFMGELKSDPKNSYKTAKALQELCQQIHAKAIDLRDTTEKKQLIDANIEGFNSCMKHGPNGEPAEDWYKYTYGK